MSKFSLAIATVSAILVSVLGCSSSGVDQNTERIADVIGCEWVTPTGSPTSGTFREATCQMDRQNVTILEFASEKEQSEWLAGDSLLSEDRWNGEYPYGDVPDAIISGQSVLLVPVSSGTDARQALRDAGLPASDEAYQSDTAIMVE